MNGKRSALSPSRSRPSSPQRPVPEFKKRSLKVANLNWTIFDFRRREEKLGSAIISDPFSTQEDEMEEPLSRRQQSAPAVQFRAYFYPNGYEDPDHTSLYLLVSAGSLQAVKARFAVSIMDKNNDVKVRKVFKEIVRPGVTNGWPRFYPRRKILDAISHILKNGTVTLNIDVHYLDEEVADEHLNAIFSLSALFAPKSKYGSEDFKHLYENKNYDISVKVGERSLPVHRLVLCTSPVIEQCLRRDRRLVFTVDGFSYRTVADVIFFMYHHAFESSEPHYADLLRFAHKYQVPALAFACELELYQSARPRNLISRFRLARDCDSSLLLQAITFLIIENVDAVTRTEEWQHVLTYDHELVTHFVRLLGRHLSRTSAITASSSSP